MGTQKGFSLIELLLAGAIFSVSAWGMAEVLMSALSADRLSEETAIASLYAEEGLEAVRSIRARDFDALAEAGSTGVVLSGGQWEFTGSEDTNGKYRRIVSIAEVRRDGSGDIVESGGDADPDTRKAAVTVIWSVSPVREDSIVLETYLTRFR
jgi:prepilin-type N-terminal cleavage/methylation domain-containing protein